jgi:hypothetical protein
LKNVWKKYSSTDPKGRKWKVGKDKESMTGKRNQRELLWFQTEGALNFITAAPHCGGLVGWTKLFFCY